MKKGEFMEHSLRSYLRRQSTKVLEVLLRDYEMQAENENSELRDMIREILDERNQQDEKPPLV